MDQDEQTVTLPGKAVEDLRKIAQSLGTDDILEALSRVIGTQAAIVDQLKQGRIVTIDKDIGTLRVTKR